MPPVIANGGYYGAPGVTAAGAYGASPADMLYSLRNQGWSDQQIMDTYGPDDPMVRIMQLENRWNQAQPGAGGYRYQYPTRTTTPARRPTAQAQAQQRAAAPVRQPAAQPATQPAAQQLTPEQQVSLERAVADPYQSLPTLGDFAPSYTSTADDYYAPRLDTGIRIRPWTDPITYGGSLNMPPMQEESSLVDLAPQYGSMYMYTGPFSGPRRSDDFSDTSLGQSIYNSLAQYRW